MKILNVNNNKVVYHYLPSRLTNIQILTNVGSLAEKPDHYGMAHILEHMMFAGSKNYPNRLDITHTASGIGGKLNAWTGVDCTCYHITTLNEFFEKGFDLLSDMYQNPLFPEEEFAKELNPILSELRRSEDSPEEFLCNRIMPELIGNEAGHPILGTESSIRAASVETMNKFHKRYYGGKNTLISIVGGISEERATDIVASSFKGTDTFETAEIPKAEFNAGEKILHKTGITEAVYLLYYPAVHRFHPDRYKQSLMTYILGGSDNGLLFEQIREILGMSCYGIFASQAYFDSHNLIEVSGGIAPEELDKCHEEVMKQIDKLMNTKIDEQRLNRAKAALRTSVALTAESSAGYNGSISISVLKGMTENPLDRLLDEVEAITTDDVLDIAQRTFNKPSYKAILLPETN